MDKEHLKKNLQEKMENRAPVNLLDSITLEAQGSKMPPSQVASLSTPDARTINVLVWDKFIVPSVEKEITIASLGSTLATDSQIIRLPIPALKEERRKELVKLAHKYGEDTKISLSSITRDGNEELKKLEKDNVIAKDEHHSLSEQVQKLTDDYSSKVESVIKQKIQEILAV